jgi:hypothetical protein
MNNPIKDLTRKEWILWLGSLFLGRVDTKIICRFSSINFT